MIVALENINKEINNLIFTFKIVSLDKTYVWADLKESKVQWMILLQGTVWILSKIPFLSC